MTGAMALFCANDALVKMFGSTLPVAQSMAIRGLIATAATLIVVAALRQAKVIPAAFDGVVVLRGLCECAAIFCLIFALTKLPIGDVTAISQIAPLIVLPLAALIYHERVTPLRWLLVALGFVGVALIAKPGGAGFDPTIGVVLLTAVGFAFRDILARRVRAGVPALAVALSTVAVVAGVSLLVAIIHGFAPVSIEQVLGLGAAGLLLAVGQGLVFLAFRFAPVSEVAPFNYTKTIFGVIAGFLAFGERPGLLTLVGIALVILSGVGVVLATTARPPR